MALKFDLVSADVKQYGTPLFEQTTLIGTFSINDANVSAQDDSTFRFDEGYYAKVRTVALNAGHTTATDREWTLAEFRATREYEYDGTTYPAGRKVLMAY